MGVGMKRVVVTGLGVVTPVGNDVPAMWKSLLAGVSGVGLTKQFDAALFDSKISAEVKGFDPSKYLTPKEIKRSERFVQFAIAASRQAVADAGVAIGQEDPFRCGVIIGSGIGSIHLIEEQHGILVAKGPKRLSP